MSYSGPITTHLALTQNITAAGPGGAPTTSTCVFDHALGGTMVITLQQSSGTATGRGQTSLTDSPVSVTGPSTCSNSGAASGPGVGGGISCDITGSPSDLGCSGTMTNTSGNGPVTFTLAFSGGLNGGVISGNVTYSVTGQLGFPGGTNNFSGSTAFAVTLR